MNEIDLEIMRVKKKIDELEAEGNYTAKMAYEDILLDLFTQKNFLKQQEKNEC